MRKVIANVSLNANSVTSFSDEKERMLEKHPSLSKVTTGYEAILCEITKEHIARVIECHPNHCQNYIGIEYVIFEIKKKKIEVYSKSEERGMKLILHLFPESVIRFLKEKEVKY